MGGQQICVLANVSPPVMNDLSCLSQWLFYIPMKIKIKCPALEKEEEGILIESPIFFFLFCL